MKACQLVEAITDTGLVGDRYADPAIRRSAGYQVTLIESEKIDAFIAVSGIALSPDMPRRNIVTAGIALNDLCGRHAKVGSVVLKESNFASRAAISPSGHIVRYSRSLSERVV